MDTNHQNENSDPNLLLELKNKIEIQKLHISDLEKKIQESDEKFLEISQSSFWKFTQKFDTLKKNNNFVKIPYHFFKAIKNKHLKQSLKKLTINLLEKTTNKILNEPEINNTIDNQQNDHLFNSNYDVLCFTDNPWNIRTQRPQQISLNFSKNKHRVFYFNPIFKNINRAEIVKKKNSIYNISLPLSQNSNSINSEHIYEVFEQYKIFEAVIYVNDLKWYSIVKELSEKYGMKIIYDINNQQFNSIHTKTILDPNHLALTGISDVNITSSKLFYDQLQSNGIQSLLVTSGNDFEFLRNPKSSSPISQYNGTHIGFIGNMNQQIDKDLLIKISKQFSESHIFLIGGTIEFESEEFSNIQNIHLIGEICYSELPAYLKDIDVFIFPFQKAQQSQAMNTGKLFEYFSTGKPVVCTDLDEFKPYNQTCYISENHEDFLTNLSVALKENNPELSKQRKEIAKNQDWMNQFKVLTNSLKTSLPKVSIVIITYNSLEYTKYCIDSVLAKTCWPNYEILIVDNASADETPQYLKEIEKNSDKIRIILNNDNLGFAGGNNQGIKEVDGDVVVLLNNDTIVTKGWLFGFVKHLADDKVGMVGPVTNWTGNEAKIEVDYTDPKDIDTFAREYTHAHLNETMELRTLAMFCVAIKREVIEKVGVLDERYKVGMFEDDDYATSVRKGGYKNICAEDVFIHHFGSVSFKKLNDEKYQKIFAENKKRFEDKWQEEWVPHKAR